MVVSGTGHRPDKLGGYSEKVEGALRVLAAKALKQLGATEVISGMALGWDMAVAEAALLLKLPLIAAVPFRGQESVWNQKTQDHYHELLAQATEVVVVSEGVYHPSKMMVRNEWMVQHSDCVLALYNGDQSGGTANCVRYALSQGVRLVNVWRHYQIPM